MTPNQATIAAYSPRPAGPSARAMTTPATPAVPVHARLATAVVATLRPNRLRAAVRSSLPMAGARRVLPRWVLLGLVMYHVPDPAAARRPPAERQPPWRSS